MADEKWDTPPCRQCDSRMVLLTIKKHPGHWPVGLVIAGLFCCLFFIGALVGIPLVLVGAYMAAARETISRCPKCGYYYEVWSKKAVSG